MHIFISHSSHDSATAAHICDFLEKQGKKCFLAPRDITPGKEYAGELLNGIDQSEAMLLIMSGYANQSPHVLREVERAVSKSIPILVYKLEDITLSKSMEYFLMTHQWICARPQEDFSELWRALCDAKCSDAAPMTADKSSISSRKPLKKSYLISVLVLTLLATGLGLFIFARKNAPEPFVCPYAPGDTLTLGSYNGEAVEWRVLKLSADETQAVLISRYILAMKAYDAAESGIYNSDGENDYWFLHEPSDIDLELQKKIHGNSDWSTSNLRTWLNSCDELVAYTDQPPMSSAMSEKRNGYQNEPGFLYHFSETELAAIIPTVNHTAGNALSDEAVTTTDLVYLLSLEELDWFEEAGMSRLAVPAQTAIEQDFSKWYSTQLTEFDMKEYCWWLRTPVRESTSMCYLVGNGYSEDNIWERNAGLEGFGVRPAITIDLRAIAAQP